jgi:undecaprenyl-diphosphatase
MKLQFTKPFKIQEPDMLEFLLELDREVFLFLNGLHTPWLDPVMYYISEKFFWIPFYMLLLWACYRQYGWKVLLILLLSAVLITMSDQLSGLLKSTVQRFRPSRDETLEGLVHIVYGKRGGRFGFVSSHAANSFALAIFMIHLLRNKVKYIVPVMITWASLKSYSRIYLGVHYPADIIGGAILGIVCALIIIQLWKFILSRYAVKRTVKYDHPAGHQPDGLN